MRSLCVVLNFEARCVVNKIHKYFFLKGCDIVWVGVFRLQYHGFHFFGQYKSLDRVFEREIEKSSVIYDKTLLRQNVNLGLFFSFLIN